MKGAGTFSAPTVSAPSTLLFIVNSAEFFLSHRMPIALAAKEAGYDVHVATALDATVERVSSAGLKWHELPMSRSGVNPFYELWTLWRIVLLLSRLRPGVVHLVTIKPVLYGGIAARLVRIHAVVASISGLGFTFSAKGMKARLSGAAARLLYGLALRHRNSRTVFQNTQDLETLRNLMGSRGSDAVLIPGSGVDLESHTPQPFTDDMPMVLFAARLLVEKGVLDFVEAARLLHKGGVRARFCIAGTTDPGNPNSLTESDVVRLREEGAVEMVGHVSDIPALMATARVVVLPSFYGEGLPKVLIEAAACGRPVVTTDHPGCRDAIDPGVTGLLVPVRNPLLLSRAIGDLVQDKARCEQMGRAAREFALRHFDVRQVVATHLAIYQQLLLRP